MKKLSFQKIFCFISFLFILSCCIFYGTRFIKLFIENQKELSIEKNSLVKVIRENNEKSPNYKEINGANYFINKADNNYLLYSNLLWRIIKVNEDNSITLISNNSLTSLAHGKTSYKESFIYNWLNASDKEYSGILENNLNQKETLLDKTETCLDTVDSLDNHECQNVNTDNYISLLSTSDFINAGHKESYLINNEYFYLNNQNKENEIWFIDDTGKVTTTNGLDIMGVRPVITIKSNIDYIAGDGTIDNPYTIENNNSLFGSYVKLDNDTWRIYQVNDNEVRLVLNDSIKVNNEDLQHIFSRISSYHDDYNNGSLAYYLNKTYLNSLSYKDIIKETNWTNGYYGNNSNYDYQSSLKDTINTKVATISIGDIKLNNTVDSYFTLTGTKTKGSLIYITKNNAKVTTNSIQSKNKVVPTICIDKSLLTKGTGTINNPLEME